MITEKLNARRLISHATAKGWRAHHIVFNRVFTQHSFIFTKPRIKLILMMLNMKIAGKKKTWFALNACLVNFLNLPSQRFENQKLPRVRQKYVPQIWQAKHEVHRVLLVR